MQQNGTLAPRAGPTGGAGLALPACSANLISPVTVGSKVSELIVIRSLRKARRCSAYEGEL